MRPDRSVVPQVILLGVFVLAFWAAVAYGFYRWGAAHQVAQVELLTKRGEQLAHEKRERIDMLGSCNFDLEICAKKLDACRTK